jgi:feruloyl-CoA synthase
MPWHHTMAGNAVLHGVLRAGGTLYIDDGRPTPETFGRTLENIRDVQPTSVQSVPAAFQLLVAELERDEGLRRAFFRRLTRITYAGASLPQEVWERMQALAIDTIGEPVVFGSGYGTTETAPGIAVTHWPSSCHGEIGLPLPRLELKLVPFGDQFEVRVRGPNVTPGYFRRPDLTRAAFDDEGYYKVGDLVEFVDRRDPAQGLRFCGRLSENFKLTCGSWVATGELRLKLLEACRPLVADVVVTGHDCDDIRLLIWASASERRRLGDDADGPLGPMIYRELAGGIAERLQDYNAGNPAKTHQIAAFRLLHEPPSMGAGETTDKGYVNQRGVLARRAALVDELYAPSSVAEVTVLGPDE